MRKILNLKRASAVALAGMMLLSARPTWAGAFPTGSAGLKAAATDGVIQVKHRRQARPRTAMETQMEHRSKCWVTVDAARNYGYMKC